MAARGPRKPFGRADPDARLRPPAQRARFYGHLPHRRLPALRASLRPRAQSVFLSRLGFSRSTLDEEPLDQGTPCGLAIRPGIFQLDQPLEPVAGESVLRG